MAHAYTPGLTVTPTTVVRKRRMLPLRGEILVGVGESVTAERTVASTQLPGAVQMLPLAARLGVTPGELERFLEVAPGSPLTRGQLLASRRGLFGLFRAEVHSPIDGTLESVSQTTGQAVLREPPVPVEVAAHVRGTVVEVSEGEGAVIECHGALVQGIFGLGGERTGTLRCETAIEVLDEAAVGPQLGGAVLVIGGRPTAAGLHRAAEVGVVAVVCGSIHDDDVRTLLGRDLGVAITGHEAIGITLVVTEGFGDLPMATRTRELLEHFAGREASVNGATQIRAGVQRPEVIVPHDETGDSAAPSAAPGQMVEGSRVRIIREPHFGATAVVSALPVELLRLPTEAEARVVRVRLDHGDEVTVPRANVELLEE